MIEPELPSPFEGSWPTTRAYQPVSELLLEHGADRETADTQGNTATDLFRRRGWVF